MIKRIMMIALALSFVEAADLAGKWTMTMDGSASDRGHIKTLTLIQTGDSLSGTLKDDGGTLKVSGSIDGDAMALTGKRLGVTVKVAGKISQNEMSGTLDILSIHKRWTAKRN